MLGRTDRRLRLVALLTVFALFAAAISVRLAYWQVGRSGDLRELARGQIQRATGLQPPRGDIVDRRGTVLATTAYRDLLSAYPDRIPDEKRSSVAEHVIAILALEGADAERIRRIIAGNGSYTVLARQLTEEQSERVREGISTKALVGVSLTPRSVRFYPNPGGAPGTTLASQLLGFVTDDGDGRYGLEERYDALLSGKRADTAALSAVTTASTADAASLVAAGAQGADIRLTIDASLQLQVEKELYAAWVANKSQRVSSLVLDPDSGDVLAWASVPGYDANAFAETAKEDSHLFSDPLASQVYEPGSVMKMFTAAAALEGGSMTPRSIVNDVQELRFGNGRVHNSDRAAMGRISFEDAIAYSRNVAVSSVALRLARGVDASAARLYETWRKFGIGDRTGIAVNGEVAGLVPDPASRAWEPIDLANRAYGQGVAVTPVQLGMAFSTMVNGGMHVAPRLVADDATASPASSRRVIDEALSNELRRLMTHVVTRVPTYAQGTLIPGYTVGGKTGTAQIWDAKRGDWAPNTYNFSFAGFVGHERAEAVIVTRIHDTRGPGYDLPITSFELFRRIARDTVGALDIPPAAGPAQRPSASQPPGAPPAGRPPVEAPGESPGPEDPPATPPLDPAPAPTPGPAAPRASPPSDGPEVERPGGDPAQADHPVLGPPAPRAGSRASTVRRAGLAIAPAPAARSPAPGP